MKNPLVENKVLAVLGPTASGKTSVALELAKRFNGVIINCDSRQVYKEMLIGTASPTEEDKSMLPHKLFNFLSPESRYNAADYSKDAALAIKSAWLDCSLPILTGGTGFYFSAISEGVGKAGSNEQLAAALKAELEKNGLSYMVEKLKKLDPEAVKTIDTNNSRRVLRALEVVEATKMPFSRNKPVCTLPEAEFYPVVVTRPREILHARIEARVDRMLKEGLEDEVLSIISKYGRGAAALSSIGYREWIDYFDGKITKEMLRQLIVIHTRQYAKRQETWFRKKPGKEFLDLQDVGLVKKNLDKVEAWILSTSNGD